MRRVQWRRSQRITRRREFSFRRDSSLHKWQQMSMDMIWNQSGVWRISDPGRNQYRVRTTGRTNEDIVTAERVEEFYYMIKKETRRMNHEELADLMNKEIGQLLEITSEETLDIQMNEKLMIEEDSNNRNNTDSIREAGPCGIRLLDDIQNVQRKKGSWLTEEQFQSIVRLLEKYPSSHEIFRKQLNLSQATLHRIKKQATGLTYHCQLAKRKLRCDDRIDELQELFIKRLLAPPTIPLTIPII